MGLEGLTLSRLLEERARQCPEKTLLRMQGVDLSYSDFNTRSNLVANGLRRLGILPREMVAVMLPNCVEFMLTWFAVAKMDAVEAPINTAFRGPGLVHILELTQSRILIVDDEYLKQLRSVADSLTCLEILVVRGDDKKAARLFPERKVVPFGELFTGDPRDQESSVGERDVAMLLFTSGTTGRSKACMLSHRYLVRQAELMTINYGIRSDDVLYCPFPLFHGDATFMTVIPALVKGATVALGERFSVSRFWEEVRAFNATVIDFMGATLTMLMKQPANVDDADNPVRLAWGVPMPTFADEFEARFGLQLVELYGLTDGGVPIYGRLDEPRRPGSCGKVVESYDVRIFGPDDRELPAGEIGEIVLRPLEPSLIMEGYYRMPEETLDTIRNLWLHTGDLGYRDNEGYFYFVGRKKEAIRRRGENISAFEIEEVINDHPAVLECAAIPIPSDLTEEDVKVCVVLRDNMSLSPHELIDYCVARMAKFMVPRYVEFMIELPKTPTEKVEKYRLREAGRTPATWDREASSSTRAEQTA